MNPEASKGHNDKSDMEVQERLIERMSKSGWRVQHKGYECNRGLQAVRYHVDSIADEVLTIRPV